MDMGQRSTRRRSAWGCAAAAATALALALGAAPAGAAAGGHGGSSGDGAPDLQRYAAGTWRSFEAMTDPASGLPADVLNADGTTSVQTSTTNIGAYLWSAYVAQRLGFLDRPEMVARMSKTIASLEHMERHTASGQFYNWYDHHTGAKLTTWPPTGAPLTPILSSVDNAWLATGLRIVRGGVPELARRAGALYDSMNFGFYYRPGVNRVLFHYVPDTGEAVCCYDTVVSESRIVDYLGIAKGEIPQRAYFGRWRTFPDAPCDRYGFQETKPIGEWKRYFGVDVFEGSYPYNNSRIVPSWGGSMFEALMPALFLPEERWGPRSWGINHPLTVQAQIHHGLTEAGYGYWGFSPSNTPEGGYAAYGVDGIGMDPNGNPSNEDRTLIDHGFAGCPGRDPQPDPPPAAYTNGVVTPHAAFLGLRYAPRETRDDLARLARDFPGLYGPYGFRDSVNVDTGHPSDAYLSLDQGMIMASLGNALGGDVLRDAFAGQDLQRSVRPVLQAEEFVASPRP
ncbi:MAG TPA: glucoamylase family protein [Baekduia sp.]|uniref:glucoamylase family protein n=1 Tax=Baekduia sp. TaxID=2600305 RepID=UPI002B7BD450|nr:glucoamylase family protein [Baekduia sp.]HMJ37440.1 glucoamylase family protein [Baekduia sp.]